MQYMIRLSGVSNLPHNDITILKELLRNEMIFIPNCDNTNQNRWVLTLTDPDNQKTRVSIVGVPESSLAIKSDYFSEVNKFFTSCRGECKRSDYILVSSKPEEKWLIYIELKSSSKNSNNKEVTQQLCGSYCFFQYCKVVVERFWKIDSFMADYKERYVVFSSVGRSRKDPLRRPSDCPIHDEPKKALRIGGRQAEFNMLVHPEWGSSGNSNMTDS